LLAGDLQKAMSITQEYAEHIRSLLPTIKSGSLRIWGQWFGRPYDNVHTISGAKAVDDALVLSFHGGETLTIYKPERSVFDNDVFRVALASRVRWEWYYYGRSRSPENLYYLDYGSEGQMLDTNWRLGETSRPTQTAPAVELL
jgi:hypothetical protein